MQINDLYDIYLRFPNITTDTRSIQQDMLFFALKGPNFNGNHFAQQALDAGAAYVIADEATGINDNRIIQTEDVLQTLQSLAKFHREQFSIPFIAITGSNGKTTTKELIHEVLSSQFITYTTKGNLNNHIGVPLTLLSIRKDAEMAVIEMGANHQKEIEGYCIYAQPTHGLITNCGKAHLEGFGGVEGVRKGKGELFAFLRNNGGTAFIMNDYAYLREMSTGIPFIHTYGTAAAEITGQASMDSNFLKVLMTGGFNEAIIQTQLVGDYNLPNVLAAIAIGKYFNMKDHAIKQALEQYVPSNSRSQLIEKDTNKIILDAYNANPTSMKAAIENFAKLEGNSKVLLLGGMAELGEESIEEHASIVALIQQYSWKAVVLVGGDFSKLDTPFHYFNKSTEACDWLKEQRFTHSTLLVKGSRSMQMEKVLE